MAQQPDPMLLGLAVQPDPRILGLAPQPDPILLNLAEPPDLRHLKDSLYSSYLFYNWKKIVIDPLWSAGQYASWYW